jgi:hypothetical protein
MPDTIAELLEIAGVPKTRSEEAAAWLGERIASLRRTKRATRRPLPKKLEARLEKLDKAAAKTITALEQVCTELDVEPMKAANFFLHVKRTDIEKTMLRVRCAVKAMNPVKGKPPDKATHDAVAIAKSFFERFSTVRPSHTEGGPFVSFCARLCEIALGTKPDFAPTGIIRSILEEQRRADRVSGAKSE